MPAESVNHPGPQITRLREAKGWTRYRLAKECGVSESILGRCESGERGVSWDTACRITTATNRTSVRTASIVARPNVPFAIVTRAKTKHGEPRKRSVQTYIGHGNRSLTMREDIRHNHSAGSWACPACEDDAAMKNRAIHEIESDAYKLCRRIESACEAEEWTSLYRLADSVRELAERGMHHASIVKANSIATFAMGNHQERESR